jgi:hypothetical protein
MLSSASTNNLVFGTNTVERARITSSGNLLVGTTSTSFEGITVAKASATYLNVYGNTSNEGGLLLGGDGIENKANVIYKPSINALQISANAASSYMYFNTAGNERARIDSSGNFGIGTTSPAAKLDVTNGASPASRLRVGVGGGAANTLYSTLAAGDYINFETNGSDRARIDSSGNLGVGVTNPSSYGKLAVDGNISMVSHTQTLFANKIAIVSSSGNMELLGGSANIVFKTGASNDERARITSGGYSKFSNNGNYSGATATYHEFYQTANSTVLLIRATDGSYGSDVLTINGDRTTTNASYNLINAYNGAISGQFIVRDSGNALNTNNSYGAISDIKLKENIVDASPKLADLMQVKVRNYNLIGSQIKQLGVVAQELEAVFPSMVDEASDKDADGNDLGTTTKSVKYSVFVPMLIKAIQEQQAIIESLKARLDAANL